MLDEIKPDVLDIVTPPETHHDLVLLACERGVPTIICQKPLAPTLDEAAVIAALAEKHGCRLVVHENFRWQPWHREIRSLVHGGALGTVLNASFRLRPGDGQGESMH
jgi:predicted dehydrogenase